MQWLMHHKLAALGVALLLGVALWYGFSGASAPSSLLSSSAPSGASQGSGQDLVQSLLTLRAVSLSGTIFSDPSFISLRDFSTQIVPEPVGRPNPFAPLGATAAATGATTQSARIFAPHH